MYGCNCTKGSTCVSEGDKGSVETVGYWFT